MRTRGDARARSPLNLGWGSVLTFGVALLAAGCPAPKQNVKAIPDPVASSNLPTEPFTRPPERPHHPADLYFAFDQLEHYYRVPGEFTHRLTGDDYGFEALSFIVTETHPGGGPGLHVHDVEEAHVLLEGSARYRLGEETFTVHAPYIARVPQGVPHSFVNAGTEPFNLVAVFPSKHPHTTRVGPNPFVPAPPERDGP